MKHPSEAAPASITNIAYDAGVVVERARVIGLISQKLISTSRGTFDAFGILTKLLSEITSGPVIAEDPKPGSCSCKGSCRKCKSEEKA